MQAADRLIAALDVASLEAAERFAAQLEGVVRRLKVGLELFTCAGPEAVHMAQRRGAQVMLDLKLHDIPETVARAVEQAAGLGVELLTVHTAGGRRMLEAATDAARRRGGPRLLGVTVLTSLDDEDLAEVAVAPSVESVVLKRARLAMDCGLAGVVASPREAARIRALAPSGFLIVTPGVRPGGVGADDQKRVASPAFARAAGADFVVVGRPIRDAPSPEVVASQIIAELA